MQLRTTGFLTVAAFELSESRYEQDYFMSCHGTCMYSMYVYVSDHSVMLSFYSKWRINKNVGPRLSVQVRIPDFTISEKSLPCSNNHQNSATHTVYGLLHYRYE